jgi:hypothetical protein
LDCNAGDIVGNRGSRTAFQPVDMARPDRFNPDRFLEHSPTPFEYVPFGGGYRRCPGAAFAHNELAISIGTVLRDVTLAIPRRDRGRKPPRAVPRGIATVPAAKSLSRSFRRKNQNSSNGTERTVRRVVTS